jgi:Zn-dependent M28 family amino/carboxypeptidase
MRKSLLGLCLFSVLASVGFQLSEIEKAIGKLLASRLKERIAVLAHDSLEGRGPATRGEARALAYIVSQVKAIGLQAAGERGSYLQRVPMIGFRIDPSVTMEMKNKSGAASLRFPDEFVATTGIHQPAVSIDGADIIFVGYGIIAPEFGWDDYKEVDVRGKILLMMNNDPSPDDPRFFGGKGRTYYGRWTYKYEIAAKKGAAGAIIIHTTESAGYPYQVVQSSRSRENFDLDVKSKRQDIKLKAWTTEQATKRFVSLAGLDLDKLRKDAEMKSFRPVPLALKLSVRMNFSMRKLLTYNVIAKLNGSDPKLGKEHVVFSAHHDHLGIGAPVNGDSIYNGALDNASGLSLMLNIAEAFSAMTVKPKRSLLFLAVAAEEKNLLGSQYYAEHPTVPAKSIVANINIDGMNIYGKTKDITFLGSERSTLGNDVEAVAREMKMDVKPDPLPEQGSFYRSDHFSFAKVGIPSLSLRAGTNVLGKPLTYAKEKGDEYNVRHYHQPSDELRDDWRYEGAIQQAEFVVRLVARIADQPEVPSWNRGDEFEKARLKTLDQH